MIQHKTPVIDRAMFTCQHCGAPLLNTGHNSVCGRDLACGRLMPVLTTRAQRRNMAVYHLGLKDAWQTKAGWFFPDDPLLTIYQKDAALTRVLAGKEVKAVPEWYDETKHILALNYCQVIVLKKLE